MQRPPDGELLRLAKKSARVIRTQGMKAFVVKLMDRYNVQQSTAYLWAQRIRLFTEF